jgi:hypothetical protein
VSEERCWSTPTGTRPRSVVRHATLPRVAASCRPAPEDGAGRERWSRLAGRVEAYREHWGIQPEDIRHPPIDGTQYHEWNAAVKTVEMIERINGPQLDHRLERGLGIEL